YPTTLSSNRLFSGNGPCPSFPPPQSQSARYSPRYRGAHPTTNPIPSPDAFPSNLASFCASRPNLPDQSSNRHNRDYPIPNTPPSLLSTSRKYPGSRAFPTPHYTPHHPERPPHPAFLPSASRYRRVLPFYCRKPPNARPIAAHCAYHEKKPASWANIVFAE